MRCRIRHDGRTVLAVKGEAIRIPTTACPAAIGVLQELVGLPLATPVRHFYRGLARGTIAPICSISRCLPSAMARRPRMRRCYEAVVPG